MTFHFLTIQNLMITQLHPEMKATVQKPLIIGLKEASCNFKPKNSYSQNHFDVFFLHEIDHYKCFIWFISKSV